MKIQGLKQIHNACNTNGEVFIIYEDYILTRDVVLKHPKHVPNDNNIFELKAYTGQPVQLIYTEKPTLVKWIISIGTYKFEHIIEKGKEYMSKVARNNRMSFNPRAYKPIKQ